MGSSCLRPPQAAAHARFVRLQLVLSRRPDMTHAKRFAVGLLLAGLLLAAGTPVYVAHAASHLSVYLLHPVILLGQAVPYVVCAALWLPWRSPTAAAPALILAAV